MKWGKRVFVSLVVAIISMMCVPLPVFAGRSYTFGGKSYQSVYASDEGGWRNEFEATVTSGKFNWLSAFTGAISANSDGADLPAQNSDDGIPTAVPHQVIRPTAGTTMAESADSALALVQGFILGGTSNQTRVYVRLQGKKDSSAGRMIMAYGAPIERGHEGQKLDLMTLLTQANSGNAGYILHAAKDADAMIRRCFSGLRPDGTYSMEITYADRRTVDKFPWGYSIVVGENDELYAYPVIHGGTSMKVYYKPDNGKRVFSFDATPLIRSQKLEIGGKMEKELRSYIKNHIDGKKDVPTGPKKLLAEVEETGKLSISKIPEGASVKYKSSNKSCIKINKKGEWDAKKKGTEEITTTVKYKDKYKSVRTVYTPVSVVESKLSLSPESVNLYAKDTYRLTVSVSGKNKKKLAWSSKNPSIASVRKGIVTAKKPGKTVVTVSLGKKKARCTVVVKKPSIKIVPKKLTLQKGSTQALQAVVKGPSKKVKWSSSNNSVATVSKKGVVKGIREGKAMITACANGVSATCRVTVKKESFQISQTSLRCIVGDGAELYGTYGSKRYTTSVKWTTSNPSVAWVNRYGTVVGIGPGSAVITAEYLGVKRKCTVHVSAGKNRTEVLPLLDGNIWSLAGRFGLGAVKEFPAMNSSAAGMKHSCPASSHTAAMFKYYTGVSDYDNLKEFKASSYPLRFEALADGKVEMIMSNSGDDFTFGGVFCGMNETYVSSMLEARGFKFQGFHTTSEGMIVEYTPINPVSGVGMEIQYRSRYIPEKNISVISDLCMYNYRASLYN